jgi:hypothetical protein
MKRESRGEFRVQQEPLLGSLYSLNILILRDVQTRAHDVGLEKEKNGFGKQGLQITTDH